MINPAAAAAISCRHLPVSRLLHIYYYLVRRGLISRDVIKTRESETKTKTKTSKSGLDRSRDQDQVSRYVRNVVV